MRRPESAFPGFIGMLCVESENPVSGLDSAFCAGLCDARPGQVFGRRRNRRTRKCPEISGPWADYGDLSVDRSTSDPPVGESEW